MHLKPVLATARDTYHDMCPWNSQSWEHHDDRFRGLCTQMPWPTMEVSCYGQLSIAHIAVYLSKLHVTRLVDSCPPWDRYTHILSHAASYSWCCLFHRQCSNVCPGSYSRWLHWQRHGGVTSVCIVAVSQRLLHLMKSLSVGSIWIHFHPAEVFVQPWFAGLDNERKMIMKRSGKSWGINI